MTRTILHGWLVGISLVIGSAVTGVVLAQSGDDSQPPRTSTYSTKAPPKGTPAAGAKSQPTSGSKGTTYGPVLPKTEQPRAPQGAGPSPVRRTAGEEPVREPISGASPGATSPAKAGGPKGAPGTLNNPIPLAAEITPRQPSWFPLAANQQAWVDEVLLAWEKTSDEIVTFKCKMQRWEYDPAFGPKDPTTPHTFGEGIVQYAKPDKGMFKVESLKKFVGAAKVGGNPWVTEIGEQWVCDGRSIFEFDTRNQRLRQAILPKEMQGKAIADGPLPFLFGAKIATIKSRYWIGPAPNTPDGHEGEYWLEAVPRYSRDAANFQKVTIILDEKDFLPKALDVYAPNYNKKTNPAHTAYAFESRETTSKKNNPLIDPEKLKFWKSQFYEPKVPSGWKKVVEDMNEIPQGPRPVQGPAAPGTATRPAAGTKTKTK